MKIPTNPTKTAMMVAVLAASLTQVAQAGFKTNDLYLGFTQDSAQSDYDLDLGQPAAVGVGGSSAVDLGSYFSLSTFNSVFTGGANGVSAAVVGGNNNFGTYGVFATQVRIGGAGDPAVAGSSIAATHSTSQMSGGASEVATILSSTSGGLPTAGNSVVDSTKSYTAVVDTTGVQNNFIGKTGVIPFGTFDNSKILYLDLYKATVSSAYTYLGYFTFDLSTGTPHLTFTPSGAAGTLPPPATRLSITRSGTTNTISFGTTNGANYQLVYSATLTAPLNSWATLGSGVTGNGSRTNFIDVTASSSRFYGVKAQ